MNVAETIERARASFERHEFGEARRLLASADAEASLTPEQLDLLARSAYLTGEESTCIDCWTRAHHGFRAAGEVGAAALCAFWIGNALDEMGESAQASGWIHRAKRQIESSGYTGVEQGYLMLPDARQCIGEGDASKALMLFRQAVELGTEYDDADLQALGLLGCGMALVRQTETGKGTACFDEAMVAVVSDELSPLVTGIVYCAVIESCRKIHDVRRTTEWTEALGKWCDARPEMIPYRGQCLVQRARVMKLRGDWTDAIDEVHRILDGFRESSPRATGEAYYLLADLHRLRGNHLDAEKAFREASRHGTECHPGLALLRLTQGRLDDAVAAVQRITRAEHHPITGARMLPACFDVLFAAGRFDEARDVAVKLDGIARNIEAPFLKALASRARGGILLLDGEPEAALERFKEAWSRFRDIGASYESARTRVFNARAYRALGDEDSARMEFEAADWMFRQLGASDDLARLEAVVNGSDFSTGYGLTPRQMEVLILLATGKTNKAIASELFISERTVDRHVSDILARLDVSTRSAATAFAYEHDLIR